MARESGTRLLLRRLTGLLGDDCGDAGPDDGWDDLVRRVTSEVRGGLCAEQLAFLDDSCRFRVACCARQCGKTFLVARLMLLTAIAGPDRIVVYVSDTFRHAREAMWDDQKDGLPAVLHSLGLEEGRHYRINLSNLRVTFANGSFVELQGADRGAWQGFRGRKIDLLVADEMQRQEQEHLELALSKDVPDCLMMRRGSFVGIGTVGRALRGIWFELNASVHGLCDPRPGWTAHHWTARELRHLTPVWEEQLAWAAAMGVDTDGDPEWLREKLGRWVRDGANLVHTVTDAGLWDGGPLPDLIRTRCPEHGHIRGRCVCDVPTVPRSQAQIVVAGLDLGAGDGTPGNGDPSAIVVLSVSPEEWVTRELHSEQRFCPGTDLLVSWMREVRERFGVRQFYVDPAWKLTANDLTRLHGLPVLSALKGDAEGTTEDVWHMERAAALTQGTMLVVRGGVLHRQLEAVLRDPRELERGHVRAAPGQDDHVFDAWRYAFRMLRTRHAQAPEPPQTEREADRQRVRDLKANAGRPRDPRQDRRRPPGGPSYRR